MITALILIALSFVAGFFVGVLNATSSKVTAAKSFFGAFKK